uniref:Uncharacterized protein n=1 Tax=Rhipicephalus appendiculatus TaxID=34631 RepID=A0A131Z3H5_RHIAP
MTLRVFAIAFIATLFITPGNAQGKDGANKRARRSLLPYTITLGDVTPYFPDFSKDGIPEEGVSDFAKETSDYEEAMKAIAALGHNKPNLQKPRDEGRAKERPQA